jgi:hypothetical protein
LKKTSNNGQKRKEENRAKKGMTCILDKRKPWNQWSKEKSGRIWAAVDIFFFFFLDTRCEFCSV